MTNVTLKIAHNEQPCLLDMTLFVCVWCGEYVVEERVIENEEFYAVYQAVASWTQPFILY